MSERPRKDHAYAVEAPTDLLHAATLNRTENGIYYLDNLTVQGQVRLDQLVQSLGYSFKTIYGPDKYPFPYDRSSERGKDTYRAKQTEMTITALPSISYSEDGAVYSFDDLQSEMWSFTAHDVLRLLGDDKIDPLIVDFIFTEGLVDTIDYANFWYYNPLREDVGNLPHPSDIKARTKDSVARQIDYELREASEKGLKQPQLQPEDETTIKVFCKKIKDHPGLMGPEQFEQEAETILSSFELTRRDVLDYLTGYFRSVSIDKIFTMSKLGAINTEQDEHIQALSYTNYFGDYDEYVNRLTEVSRLRRTLEQEKIDRARTLLTGLLQTGADYAIQNGVNPFPRALPATELLKLRGKKLMGKFINSTALRPTLDHLVPTDRDGIRVLLAKMVRDTNKDDGIHNREFTVVETLWNRT